jgi:hypothetical protein
MRKRLVVVLGLTLLLCLLVPSLALARGTTSLDGVSSTYTVVKGANLYVSGQIAGDPDASNWNRHPRLKIQRYYRGDWRTVAFVRPKAGGIFSAKLKKPFNGAYRVVFPGCVHYRSTHKDFSVKYDPQLSISTPTMTGEVWTLARTYDKFVLSATVRSALSPSYLSGGYLTIRSYESTDGVNYDMVGTLPSSISFGRSNSAVVDNIVVPATDSYEKLYRWYKVEAVWSGGKGTGPGSVMSTIINVGVR